MADKIHDIAADVALGPEPRLGVDEFAEVSVELDEEREPRAAILERHGSPSRFRT